MKKCDECNKKIDVKVEIYYVGESGTILCEDCGAMLFDDERGYSLGEGIDMELFVERGE